MARGSQHQDWRRRLIMKQDAFAFLGLFLFFKGLAGRHWKSPFPHPSALNLPTDATYAIDRKPCYWAKPLVVGCGPCRPPGLFPP